jgi:hypothetical protein
MLPSLCKSMQLNTGSQDHISTDVLSWSLSRSGEERLKWEGQRSSLSDPQIMHHQAPRNISVPTFGRDQSLCVYGVSVSSTLYEISPIISINRLTDTLRRLSVSVCVCVCSAETTIDTRDTRRTKELRGSFKTQRRGQGDQRDTVDGINHIISTTSTTSTA